MIWQPANRTIFAQQDPVGEVYAHYGAVPGRPDAVDAQAKHTSKGRRIAPILSQSRELIPAIPKSDVMVGDGDD
jgi:hypothetical protein